MSSYPTSSLRRFQLLLTGRPSISFLDQSEYRNGKIVQRNTHNLSMTQILDDTLLEETRTSASISSLLGDEHQG